MQRCAGGRLPRLLPRLSICLAHVAAWRRQTGRGWAAADSQARHPYPMLEQQPQCVHSQAEHARYARQRDSLSVCVPPLLLLQGGEDMDMDDAPPQPQGPVVDEDGFQVVQRKGRGRR